MLQQQNILHNVLQNIQQNIVHNIQQNSFAKYREMIWRCTLNVWTLPTRGKTAVWLFPGFVECQSSHVPPSSNAIFLYCFIFPIEKVKMFYEINNLYACVKFMSLCCLFFGHFTHLPLWYIWVRSCLLITLIKCLKGHKSVGLLFNVKIKSTVSEWVSQRQKNPVCKYALHTGKFLRVRKVFARIYKIDP